jgi:hypothetical protein
MTYGSLWWATVYAADPVYRYKRGDGPKPMPTEAAAAAAAVEELILRGILVE